MPRKSLLVLTIAILLLVISFLTPDSKSRKQDTLGSAKKETQPTRSVEKTPTITLSVQPVGNADYFPVTAVVDGDTVRVVMNGQEVTLRLIGIDTPESVDPRRPIECYGLEASNKMKELVLGKSVALEADESQSERDKYGRLLRYIFLTDGTFINKVMIDEGFAYEYTYDVPYLYQEQFRIAQTNAEKNSKGLWGNPSCSDQNIQKSVQSRQKPVDIIDKDCTDFSNQKEAQAFFESQGGPTNDPHRLDVDKNGQACESLE